MSFGDESASIIDLSFGERVTLDPLLLAVGSRSSFWSCQLLVLVGVIGKFLIVLCEMTVLTIERDPSVLNKFLRANLRLCLLIHLLQI